MKPAGVRRLFRFPSRTPADVAADVRDEFAFHLEMREQELIAAGVEPVAARAQALQEFGRLATATAACSAEDDAAERRRTMRRLIEEARQDVRYGLRLIRRGPGFAVTVALTLALAIGGNTAIFSIVNALILKPLPAADPREIIRVRPGQNNMSWPNLEDIRMRNGVVAEFFAQRNLVPAVATGGDPVRVTGTAVSTNYFSVLGVAALAGRTFTPADARTDVVVISHRLWRTRFDGAPDAVGRVITIDGRAHEILGVMPRAFRGVAPPGLGRDLWLPIDFAGAERRFLRDREAAGFEVFGRLRPGVDAAAAAAALRVTASRLKTEHPGVNDRMTGMQVAPASGITGFLGISALLPVFAFLALVAVVAALVLLVACANIAGLLLGRAAARRREIAVRLALGAGRGRLVRQLLTESVLLALAGGAGGVLIAGWITSAVPLALGRLPFPVEVDLALDLRVLLYSLVVSCGAALIFGLAPARRAAAGSLTAALKDEAGASGRQRLRHALVIGQVAVCSALLLWGGLFTRSLANVGSIDPGFDPDGVLLADLPISDLAGGATDESARESVVREFHERALAMPGVRAVGMGFVVPLALFSREEYGVRIDTPGAEPRAGRVVANTVTPGFFGAIRIPVISGRDFTWRDRQGAPPVVIVNQTAARRFWNGSAVGRRLQIPDDDRWMTVDVVGVVGDSKYWTLGEEIAPTVYTPYSQRFSGNTLFVRTTDMPAAAGALRAELRRRAPNQPIEVQPMTASIGVAIMPARVGAIVTTTFGVVAMLLSVMGIYGMVAFSVAQRRREIGIRRAIGARARDIVRVVIGGSLARAVAGLAIGIGAGCLLAQAFRGFIVNVSTADPLTIAAVLAAVTGVTLAASTLPALRASRIDPLATLRQD